MKFSDSFPLTLFCLPCAGASASIYLSWRKVLPVWIRVEPVELPGRGKRLRDGLFYDYDTLVQHLTNELERNLTSPYVIFGHSLGGLLAYGCAHRLRERRRRPPLALVAACCSAPSRRDDERYKRLNTDDDLIQELRKLNGTPPEVFEHTELLRMTIEILSADFKVCASFTYVPRDPLPTQIFVYGGRHDEIEESALSAWSLETSAATMLQMFDGGHFFIRENETLFLSHLHDNLQRLAREL